MAGNCRRVSFSQGDYPPRNRNSYAFQPKRASLNPNIMEDTSSETIKSDVQDIDTTDYLEHSVMGASPKSIESQKQSSNSKLSIQSILKTRTAFKRNKSLLRTNETNTSETKNLSSHGIFLVPIEIFEIVHLRRLILSHNHLSCVPREICSLVHLNYLDISYNPLVLEDILNDEPCFPHEFHHLTNLQTLIVADCNLRDIPAVIWSTTSLIKLDLSGNKVGYISGEIGNLVNLQYLRLCRMGLVTLPAEIAFCDQIKMIDILENPIDNLPETLTECRQLSQLKLNYKQFSKTLDDYIILLIDQGKVQSQHIPSIIFELEGLAVLDLEETKINSIPAEQTLFNLTELFLSNNSFHEIPQSVCMISQLKVLDISMNHIRTISKHLLGLTRLEQLNLSKNRLTSLSELFAGLPMLKKLIVSHNQIYTIEEKFSQSRSLLLLDLSYNHLHYFANEFCELIQLQMLDIRYNQLGSLPLSIRRMTGLKSMNSFNDVSQRTGLHLVGNSINNPPSFIWKSTDIEALFVYMDMEEKRLSRSFYHLKLIFIGPKGVGKTTFVTELLHNESRISKTRKTLAMFTSKRQLDKPQLPFTDQNYLSGTSSQICRTYPPPLKNYRLSETSINMVHKSTFSTKNNLYCAIIDLASATSFEILYPLMYDSNALYILPINLTSLLEILQNTHNNESHTASIDSTELLSKDWLQKHIFRYLESLSSHGKYVSVAVIGLIDDSKLVLPMFHAQTLLREIQSRVNTFLLGANVNHYSRFFPLPIDFKEKTMLTSFLQQLERIAQQRNVRHHKHKQQLIKQRLGLHQQRALVMNYETCFRSFQERNLTSSIATDANEAQEEINQMSFDECLNYLKLTGDILCVGKTPHSILILQPDYLLNKIFAHTLFRPDLDCWLNYRKNPIFQFSGYYSSEELFAKDRQRLRTNGEFSWRLLKILFYELTANNINVNELSIIEYCRLMERLQLGYLIESSYNRREITTCSFVCPGLIRKT
ncbi:unnamed protein product [Adineta ricciae]|uniref:Uncharacterized protein n=1 Tax=Adineta ricciae TaxID=249248 RepID=A0A814GFE8_ADIRI|nr:unnamed protein product [Adineta ricciae]